MWSFHAGVRCSSWCSFCWGWERFLSSTFYYKSIIPRCSCASCARTRVGGNWFFYEVLLIHRGFSFRGFPSVKGFVTVKGFR